MKNKWIINFNAKGMLTLTPHYLRIIRYNIWVREISWSTTAVGSKISSQHATMDNKIAY
jgi:hypothetical protein